MIFGHVRCHASIAAALLATLSGAGALSPARAEAVNFAPHRATYDLVLYRSKPGSGIADMSGRMVYELSGSACEGYTQNMRFVTRSAAEDGGETTSDIRTSSWEDAKGSRLRFNSTQYQNDNVVEASQGDARRESSNKGVAVDLFKPATKTAKLPGQVTFPMQHAKQMIVAAQAGKSYVTADLYDGSEKGEKFYITTAFIGKRVEPGSKKMPAAVKAGEKLDMLPSWPVSISYFEPGADKVDSAPSYELSFRYYSNGVTSSLKIDYGDFALKGELSSIEFLPNTNCDPGEH